MACDINRAAHVGQSRCSAGSLIVERPNPRQLHDGMCRKSDNLARRWMTKCFGIICLLMTILSQLLRHGYNSPRGPPASSLCYMLATSAPASLMPLSSPASSFERRQVSKRYPVPERCDTGTGSEHAIHSHLPRPPAPSPAEPSPW